jgi:hypothetical protein
MLGVLRVDRREQTGLRSKELLSLDWPKPTNTIREVRRQDWDALTAARGNGALAAAFFLGQRYAGLRLREMGKLAGGLKYRGVGPAMARFEKRLKIDREVQKKLKRVAKTLRMRIEI